MRARRWLKRLFTGCLLVAAAAVALYFILRPELLSRTEIYRGVYLTVEETSSGGRAMIVEAHWDNPGIRIGARPYSFGFSTANPLDPHYRLTSADWALWRSGASVLMNGTIYGPDAALSSFPGAPVRSNETVVVDGRASHVHEHSYLLYWDSGYNARMLDFKPPSADAIAEAVLGVGLGGVQVSRGIANYNAIADRDRVMNRTFIGVDPERKILWLMAFEKATATEMIDRAVLAGVMFGGQLDSGNSTNLLIGGRARGIRPHTGIRNWRPLGHYLTIEAEPLHTRN